MEQYIPRSVLVTGASRRIGRTISLDFGRRGWAVAVHYNRSITEAQDVVREINSSGGVACSIAGDLLYKEQVQRLIPQAAAMLGPLGCLVNNASFFEEDSVYSATPKSLDTHIRINLCAPFVLTQAFAHQLPVGRSGIVINIIDQRVWNLTPHFTSYTVSKVGLWSLTQTLALALAPYIRVNAIGPGPTLPSIHQTSEQFTQQCYTMPLQHGTTPDEITSAVRFIVSANAMTGQMLALDGGQHLGWDQPRDGNTRE